MYIGKLQRELKQEKKVWIINFSVMGLFFLYTLYLCIGWMVTGQEAEAPQKMEKPQAIFSHEEIGYGPWGLNGVRSCGPLPALSKEIVILGYNTRPGVAEEDKTILLSLRSCQEQKIVLSGETVYLKEEGDGFFSFSPERTSFSIKPLILNDDETKIGVFHEGKEGSFILKKTKF